MKRFKKFLSKLDTVVGIVELVVILIVLWLIYNSV